MKNSHAILAVGLSGLLGGLAANLARPANAPALLAESNPSTSGNSSSSSLEEALDSLREENQEFRGRLIALENRDPADKRAPLGGAVSKAEFRSLEDEVRRKESRPIASEVFEEKVADALSGIRKKEGIEKALSRQDQWSENLEGRISEASDWLGMDSYQENQYRVALESQHRRNEELLQMWQDGTPRSELVPVKASNFSQHMDEMGAFLNAEQMATYAESRSTKN